MNSSDWVADCGSLQMDSYMAQYYGIGFNSTVRTIPTVVNNYTERKLEAVLAYAMKGCEAGLLLNPQGSCAEVPSALQPHLPDTVTPGANVDPPGCSRFNASHGADACADTSTPPTCTWSWLTYTCEQETLPPGVIAEEACSDDLKDSCETWEEEFRTEHPTLNCDVREYCMPSNWDCLVMRGDFVVHVLNETAFFLNRTLTESSLQGALVSVTGVHEEDVAITLPTWRRLDDQGSSEELSVSFTLQNVPRTLKPKTVVRSGAKTAEEINQLFFASLGSNDTVETVDFDDYDLLSLEEWMMKFAAQQTDTRDGAEEENATAKPPIKLP